MRKVLTVSALATSLVLTGCKMPDKLAAPDPVATWLGRADSIEISFLTFNRDGTFSAEVLTDRTKEPKKLSGRWTIGTTWQERPCWDRVNQKGDQFDELMRTSTGKRVGNERVSRADITLRYWVPKGTDLPVGAKVIEKRFELPKDLSRGGFGGPNFTRTGSLYPMFEEPRPPLPDGAVGAYWLVEEDAKLTRIARAASSSGRLLLWPVAVLSECLGAPDKSARMNLRFRKWVLEPKAS